jgi:hypothetical protein
MFTREEEDKRELASTYEILSENLISSTTGAESTNFKQGTQEVGCLVDTPEDDC